MRRNLPVASRLAASAAALALALLPTPVAAAPVAKAPPRMLHGDQFFKSKDYKLWVQGDITPGRQTSFLFCGYETMPEADTLHRHFDADNAWAVQYVTEAASPAAAQTFASTWLRQTLACTSKRVMAGKPTPTTKIVQLGRVKAEDGLRLAGLYYHTPKGPFYGADDDSRLFAVGVDGSRVMTLEVALPDKSPPVKKFRALATTALEQLYK